MLLRRRILSVILVVAAIAVVALTYYYYTSLPSPSIGEASLRILGHTSHVMNSGSVEFFVIEGIVENNSTANAHVNVTATYYGAENVTLGNRTTTVELDVLKPGQKSPFVLYWALHEPEITYKLDLSYTQTSEQPVDVLEFVDLTNQTEDDLFTIRGRVVNKRVLDAHSVRVVCAYYGANGDFGGLSRFYIVSIDASGSAQFELSIDASGGVASYDLMASAGGYEETSIANYVLFGVLVLVLLGFVIFMKRRGW